MTKPIDWEKVDNMLIAGCNGVQAAAAIGVHPDTLYNKCKYEKNLDFSAYSQIKRSHGDGLLHAAQYQKAIKEKNPTMLIWLGKQRLGQKENAEVGAENLSQLVKILSSGEREISQPESQDDL